ncbi:MAG: histidinol-phosphate transaminase [Ruthenibacterium sp.]
MSRFLTPRFAALTPYTPGEQPQNRQDCIKLNTNENPYAPSPRVMMALNRAEICDLRLYSDPACATFLQTLATTYEVKNTQVFAGNGSDEVLAFSFLAFCANGAAFADLTYGFYPVFARLFGVSYHEIPLREDYTLAVEDYAGESGTVFLANPNAPTGLALPRTAIETLLCQNKNRLVIVDEAYVDFGGESAVPLLQKYENLLVIGTFSKSRNLAGARLGYAIGSEALIADLNTVKFSFNPYNVNRLTLLAGTAALQDAPYFAACCSNVIATRTDTAAALTALGFTVLDSKTNFLFAAPPPPHTGAAYYDALRAENILVRHFDAPRTRNFVRISIGTKQQMQMLLSVTKSWLGGL